jgi:pyruvate/2-oxoglutarate dehydrogenase complex dihydrolipoamide dehydrogenase (E3) component
MNNNTEHLFYKNIIVGGGPAGIQTAYFLNKHQNNYIVLERASHPGSFFSEYPKQRRLISINKVHCGSSDEVSNIENILRYDWNSLLQDRKDTNKLLFKHYSQEYYPNASTLVTYLDDFVTKYSLNILYSITIRKIIKCETHYFLYTSCGKIFECERLFMGTGLIPNVLPFDNKLPKNRFFYYHNIPSSNEMFINKKVLILGGGNASFELGNKLNEVCNELVICGSERFAWRTHYPGGIRSINMNLIDSYYLKLKLNIDWCNSLSARTDQKWKDYLRDLESGALFTSFDFVIYCGGFRANIESIEHIKIEVNPKTNFPILSSTFESSSKNLFFIGALSQDHDYKHGTSAFIHGFRYNSEFVCQYLSKSIKCEKFHSSKDLCELLMRQINQSSTLLHRFDFFCDCVLVKDDHLLYIQHIPIRFVGSSEFIEYFKLVPTSYFIIYLGYDSKNKFENSFKQPQTGNSMVNSQHSVFLHPIIKFYEGLELIHTYNLPENAFNMFISKRNHYNVIYKLIHLLSCKMNKTMTVDKDVLESFERLLFISDTNFNNVILPECLDT